MPPIDETLYEFDYAGPGAHPRFTCLACGYEVVRQPYMSQRQWEEAKEKFFKQHDSVCHRQKEKE